MLLSFLLLVFTLEIRSESLFFSRYYLGHLSEDCSNRFLEIYNPFLFQIGTDSFAITFANSVKKLASGYDDIIRLVDLDDGYLLDPHETYFLSDTRADNSIQEAVHSNPSIHDNEWDFLFNSYTYIALCQINNGNVNNLEIVDIIGTGEQNQSWNLGYTYLIRDGWTKEGSNPFKWEEWHMTEALHSCHVSSDVQNIFNPHETTSNPSSSTSIDTTQGGGKETGNNPIYEQIWFLVSLVLGGMVVAFCCVFGLLVCCRDGDDGFVPSLSSVRTDSMRRFGYHHHHRHKRKRTFDLAQADGEQVCPNSYIGPTPQFTQSKEKTNLNISQPEGDGPTGYSVIDGPHLRDVKQRNEGEPDYKVGLLGDNLLKHENQNFDLDGICPVGISRIQNPSSPPIKIGLHGNTEIHLKER